MFDRGRLDHDGKYPVYRLQTMSPANGRDQTRPTQHESMGTKPKVWLNVPGEDTEWLLKRGRPGTGEHWAEKIAYEVGLLLGLPIAEVQLADWNDEAATLCKGFKQAGQSLIHGNELLSRVNPEYPKDDENYQTKEHTVPAVRDALCSHGVLIDSRFESAGLDAFGVFVGYLLLDALVCNTDRHHENWAVIANGSGTDRTLVLAPTYDHASSLGRELHDPKRSIKLTTNDGRGNVRAYCDKATSALFERDGAERPLSCHGAYLAACSLDPRAAEYWRQIIGRLAPSSFQEIVEGIPDGIMTPLARSFSVALLTDRLQVLQDSDQ